MAIQKKKRSSAAKEKTNVEVANHDSGEDLKSAALPIDLSDSEPDDIDPDEDMGEKSTDSGEGSDGIRLLDSPPLLKTPKKKSLEFLIRAAGENLLSFDKNKGAKVPVDSQIIPLLEPSGSLLTGLAALADHIGFTEYDPDEIATFRLSKSNKSADGPVYVNSVSICSNGTNACISWGGHMIPISNDQDLSDGQPFVTTYSSAEKEMIATYKQINIKLPMQLTKEAREDTGLDDAFMSFETFEDILPYLRVNSQAGSFMKDTVEGDAFQIESLDHTWISDATQQWGGILSTDHPELRSAYAIGESTDWEGKAFPVQAVRSGMFLDLTYADGTESTVSVGMVKLTELKCKVKYKIVGLIPPSNGRKSYVMIILNSDGQQMEVIANSQANRLITRNNSNFSEDNPGYISFQSIRPVEFSDGRTSQQAVGVVITSEDTVSEENARKIEALLTASKK